MHKRTYTIARFSSVDDVNWNDVETANIDIHKWNDEKGYPSWAKLAYINNYGYICKMHCDQKDPWVFCHEEGGEVYKDSALEFFVCLEDNNNTNADYLNLEVNAEGVTHQKYGNKKEGRFELNAKNGKAFEVDALRGEKSWELLMYLPFKKLRALCPDFDETHFHINFYKTGLDPKNGKFHYQMWNECDSPKPNFHPVAYYGDAVLA